jgi:predicted nucleotide-binding protein
MSKKTKRRQKALLYLEDDEFTLNARASELEALSGWEIVRCIDSDTALKVIDQRLTSLTGILLDVRCDPGERLSNQDTHGGYRTGICIAQYVRKLDSEKPILAVTALPRWEDPYVHDWFYKQRKMSLVSSMERSEEIIAQFLRLTGQDSRTARVKVFIVHGHNKEVLLELKDFIQNSLGLGEPTILAEKPSKGLTIIEKFEIYAQDADLVFVLVTKDDIVTSTKAGEKRLRPRQNVVFELGYFMGVLKRRSGRIIVLVEGDVELPSDISGMVYLDISGGIRSIGEDIRKEVADLLETSE